MAWKKMKLGDALINREGRYKPNEKAFWNALGAEQMGHHLMTYGIIFVAVGSNI